MDYFQSFCLSIGNYGCYALCLINLAEEYLKTKLDILPVLENGIRNGYIHFNYSNYKDDDNFYVENPVAFLKMLTGKSWTCKKELGSYVPKENEYLIEWWSVDNKSGHFARTKKSFNPLQYSRNVALGKIGSYRVFTVI